MSLSRYSSDSEFANRVLASLTADERGYFIACTDIFHDKQYNVNGRPSVSSQLQNTVILNLTKSITASDFGAGAGNWDCNIVSLPFITTQNMQTVVDNGFNVELPTTLFNPVVGGVTCIGGASGLPLSWTSTPGTQWTTLNANTAIFPQYTGSSTDPVSRVYYQILSIGMEIINATPELYRGGNVVRYRVPTQGRAVPIAPYDPTTPYVAWPAFPRENFRCFPLPPSSASFASQYPDSVIDEAVEGSYQMHTLQDNVSDFYVSGNERVFFSSPDAAQGTFGNSLISASTFSTSADYDLPLIRGDFDIVGSYFTGLTPQSILTIRYRVVLSQVPSSSDAFLSSLSKMSPPANDELDMLVSKVQNLFLPGIRAGMNPEGEWWNTVVKSLGRVAKASGKSALKTALNVGLQEARIAAKVSPEATAALQLAIETSKMFNKKKKKPQQKQGQRSNKPSNGPKTPQAGMINSGKK